MLQVVNSKPVAQLELILLQPQADLVNTLALFTFFVGEVDKQALAQGSAQRIHHIDFPVGIAFRQILGGHLGRVAGVAERRGKGDA